MKRDIGILVALVSVTLSGTAPAGIIFKRNKPSAQRAQELIGILRGDASESKRASAADELGGYDPKTYPEIVPPLLQALQDSSSEVRQQAVQSLGKYRPVSTEIGTALEQTLAGDASTKVRLSARTTLWSYQLAGYRSPKNDDKAGPSLTTKQEPPLADPAPRTPPALAQPMPRPTPANVQAAPPSIPRAMPRAPEGPVLQPPAPAPPEEGPVLNPPF